MAKHRRIFRLKIIDKYLIRQFLQTLGFALIAFTAIFVVIDAVENLDDFVDQGVSVFVVLHYYFVFTPEIIKLMTPVSVLFAALFTTGKAANLSELTAIKASGVSLVRFMAPFIAASLLISAVSIYFAGYLVPMANRTKLGIEMEYLKRGFTFFGSNIFFQDSKTRIVTIAYFDNNTNQANRVMIQEFSPDDLTVMNMRIDATRMDYDSVNGYWKAFNGTKRTFSGLKEFTETFNEKIITDLNFTAEDLLAKQQKPEQMDLTELRELVEAQSRAGNDPTRTLIEYYSRFSFPMASIVVILFGLPLATSKRRGGLAVQVGINILLTFIYLVFMKISQAYGKNGAMDPLLTAWFANLVFLAAAIINLPRVRQ